MTPARPVARVLSAAVLVAGAVAVPVAEAGGATTVPGGSPTVLAPETMPLRVALTTLTPATVPEKGVITLAGRLRNSSDGAFEDVNVMPFVSSTPLTSRDALAAAAATSPATVVGNRLTDPGAYARIGDLAPGQRASFRVRVPVDSLEISGAPGVYWIGVHALGGNADGRGLVGLARSFIPLVPNDLARGRSTPVSLVLPLRERVRRATDGRLGTPERWARMTSPDGRLSRMAALAATAGDAPLGWVVDPAVLDAVEDFADGNPSLGLKASRDAPAESPPPSPATDAGPAPPAESEPGPDDAPPSDDQRRTARALLDTLVAALDAGDLMVLGYADPDAAAVARRAPALLARAAALTQRRLAARQLTGTPVVDPADGYLDPDLLGRLPAGALLLLSDHGALELPVASRVPSGQDLVLTDARASAGGPGPTRAHGALALRQRILAESSLELNSPSPRPVVLSLPSRWDPGADWREADLFGVLRRTPWVRLASLPRDASVTFRGSLPYSRTRQAEELPQTNMSATRRLVRTGTVVGHLLTGPSDIPDRLAGTALGASSWHARERPKAAVAQVAAADTAVRARLDRVLIVGTEFVTLSGGSGSLTVALVNGLDQPVTVGIQVVTDSPTVRIETPDVVQMGPGQRTTLRLPVTSPAGVHEVTLNPVTAQGDRAGQAFTFSLRTSQVSQLIWLVIGLGAGLLGVMIVRRIALRIREHRRRSPGRVGGSVDRGAGVDA